MLHKYNVQLGISQPLLGTNPAVGFTNIVTSFSNGIATCNFTRANSLSGVSNYFNQNSQYYLLTASGPLSSSGLYFIFKTKLKTFGF
jgi:hypothetical protein